MPMLDPKLPPHAGQLRGARKLIAPIALVIPARAPRRSTTRTLGASALSHAGLVALLALLAPGCNPSSAGTSAPAAPKLSHDEALRTLDEVVLATTPMDATATSDKQDAWVIRQREVLERARLGGPELGKLALERFNAKRDKLLDVRAALLDVAAHGDPEAAAPVLEASIKTYDGVEGLGLRTRSVEILADTSPQRAIAMFEPMLRDSDPHSTRPTQEALVLGWGAAARKLGLKDAPVLCDLAVNLKQPPDARYAAVNELAKFGGQRAMKALEEVLVEASSDGLMRRKAAQALADIMPRKEFCERLTEVSAHESDENFLMFLDSMLQRYCAQ